MVFMLIYISFNAFNTDTVPLIYQFILRSDTFFYCAMTIYITFILLKSTNQEFLLFLKLRNETFYSIYIKTRHIYIYIIYIYIYNSYLRQLNSL